MATFYFFIGLSLLSLAVAEYKMHGMAPQGTQLLIECEFGNVSSIISADYGAKNCTSKDVKDKVQRLCIGQPICSIRVDDETLGGGPCPTHKDLIVEAVCSDSRQMASNIQKTPELSSKDNRDEPSKSPSKANDNSADGDDQPKVTAKGGRAESDDDPRVQPDKDSNSPSDGDKNDASKAPANPESLSLGMLQQLISMNGLHISDPDIAATFQACDHDNDKRISGPEIKDLVGRLQKHSIPIQVDQGPNSNQSVDANPSQLNTSIPDDGQSQKLDKLITTLCNLNDELKQLLNNNVTLAPANVNNGNVTEGKDTNKPTKSDNDDDSDDPKGNENNEPQSNKKNKPKKGRSQEPKANNKNDPKDDNGKNAKGEGNKNPKGDNKDDPKGDNDEDSKGENSNNPEGDNKDDPKADKNDEPNGDGKTGSKGNSGDEPAKKDDDDLKDKTGDSQKGKSDEEPPRKEDSEPNGNSDNQPRNKDDNQPKGKDGEQPKDKSDNEAKDKDDSKPKSDIDRKSNDDSQPKVNPNQPQRNATDEDRRKELEFRNLMAPVTPTVPPPTTPPPTVDPWESWGFKAPIFAPKTESTVESTLSFQLASVPDKGSNDTFSTRSVVYIPTGQSRKLLCSGVISDVLFSTYWWPDSPASEHIRDEPECKQEENIALDTLKQMCLQKRDCTVTSPATTLSEKCPIGLKYVTVAYKCSLLPQSLPT